MRSQNWATIAAGAVLIPIAAGWTWLSYGQPIIVCLRCRKQIPGASKFCPNCGLDIYGASPAATASAPSFCTECGKPLKPRANFCGFCGTKV
jgi:predicted amidophosphoribosyltransferase